MRIHRIIINDYSFVKIKCIQTKPPGSIITLCGSAGSRVLFLVLAEEAVILFGSDCSLCISLLPQVKETVLAVVLELNSPYLIKLNKNW